MVDMSTAILEFWNSDAKKPFWPESAGSIDSVYFDNTTVESARDPEYTNCVTTEKKLSTLTQENCNNMLSST